MIGDHSNPTSRIQTLRALGLLLFPWLPALSSAMDLRAVDVLLRHSPRALYWGDRNGDPLLDLFVLLEDRVEIYLQAAGGFPQAASESIELPGEPSLVDFGKLPADRPGSPDRILLFTDRGVLAENADRSPGAPRFLPLLNQRGVPQALAAMRIQALGDLNGDSIADLLLPLHNGLQLYLGRKTGFSETGGFEKSLQLAVKCRVTLETGGPDVLKPLRTGVSIPRLSFKDLDGDGQSDITAATEEKTLYFLQRRGQFPAAPSYELDLSRFDDPEAEKKSAFIRPSLRVDEKDLDGDGRIDYLISSQQRIRVFYGSKDGAHFEQPDVLLKVSDELLGVSGMDVDEDGLSDLVAFKFQMPGVSKILAALFVSMSFDLESLGYRNLGSRKFSRRPDFRNRLTFTLPPLLDVLENYEALTQKFLSAAKNESRAASGDLNGDGAADLVFLEEGSEGAQTLRIFLARSRADRLEGEQKIARVLFDKEKTQWALEEVLDFVASSSFAAARKSVEGRKPEAEILLGKGCNLDKLSLEARDLDGDKKPDIVLRWQDHLVKVVLQK